jgi:SAM-dependent methyltransferase
MAMRGKEMKRFWDERAQEDALYFVDNELAYGDPDEEAFWAKGTEVVDNILEFAATGIEPTDRVVEIGCGVGRLTRELAGLASHVDAIDVSEQMLDLARSYNAHLTNVTWIAGDGESLAGIADESADVCFSHVVFQHIPDPEITLGYVREMGRVLATGGWAAFQISNDPRVHRRRGLLARLAGGLSRGPRGQAHPAWRGSAVDLGDLETTAGSAGMSIERTIGEDTQFCFVMLRKRDASGATSSG